MTTIDDDIDFVEHHYDPMSERVQTPYELYGEMRKRCPVAHSDAHEENGFWIFSRYQDVLRAARDHDTYSNAGGITLPAVGLVRPLIPLEYDPPLQTSYRGLLSEGSRVSLAEQGDAFGPDELAAFEASAERDTAVSLRRADDEAKVVGLRVPGLDRWEPVLRAVAANHAGST